MIISFIGHGWDDYNNKRSVINTEIGYMANLTGTPLMGDDVGRIITNENSIL